MRELFLSASVPQPEGGRFFDDADPFLIQFAVRELVTAVLGRRKIIFGGHPAITPMIWAVCEDLGVSYAAGVVIYQSRFFTEWFPEENARFGNVEYVDGVAGDREASLLRMREAMLSRADLDAAVFIGGMQGVMDEHAMFERFHPNANMIAVSAPGGAARELAQQIPRIGQRWHPDIDFVRLFHERLNISPNEPRL